MSSDRSPFSPPSGLTNISSNGMQQFMLQSNDMQLLQAYLNVGIDVPTTIEELEQQTYMKKIGSDYNDLLTAYKSVKEHCNNFRTKTLKEIVSCASNVYSYGNDASFLMEKVTEIINKWDIEKEPQKKIVEIVDEMIKTVESYAREASDVKDKIAQFHVDTSKDKKKLDSIHKKHLDELEKKNNEIKILKEKINDTQKEIDKYNSVNFWEKSILLVLDTKDSIAIFIFGDDEMKKNKLEQLRSDHELLHRYGELKDMLRRASDELASDMKLVIEIKAIDTSLKEILPKINKAIEALGRIESAWGALADNLKNIRSTLQNRVIDASTFIKSLGVELAIKKWKETAKLADDYRKSAYAEKVPLDKFIQETA
ncbi:9570_t:CDS:1 [Gigaspora margarita]|uniref:9570_t:CDS:1 n=1 Tax=Gigaspora margarita TaxID=4874 RepID=A0ABN7V2L6_GIGMA|nr:9570_t:CDS:1 [Gigaspora margarita]